MQKAPNSKKQSFLIGAFCAFERLRKLQELFTLKEYKNITLMMYEYYTSKINEMAYFLGFLANFPSFIFFLLYIDEILNMKIISSDR